LKRLNSLRVRGSHISVCYRGILKAACWPDRYLQFFGDIHLEAGADSPDLRHLEFKKNGGHRGELMMEEPMGYFFSATRTHTPDQ
jgi:hypothetical protein